MNLLNRFLIPALDGSERSEDVNRYISFYGQALARSVPPYFTRAYGESFRLHVNNPFWVIQSLISNAVKEAEGSRDLSFVADECADISLASDLTVHFQDEARHCKMYVELIDTVFPDAFSGDMKSDVLSVADRKRDLDGGRAKTTEWKMLDYLIQINLGEVRTRIHQKMMEPVLEAYCPEEKKGKLCGILCSISRDECCHIQYTASRIGSLSREFSRSAVEELFDMRFNQFNAYTIRELGRQATGLFSTDLVRDR